MTSLLPPNPSPQTAPLPAGEQKLLPPASRHFFSPFWFRREMLPFWLIYAALLIVAIFLRARRLDMPPFDYPAARQIWNTWITNRMIEGATLLETRHGWVELQYLSWITARTAWLANLLGIEIWTLGRCWSALFGTLTVALAPFVMELAAPSQLRPARRLRIALLFMAALSFHPYLAHVSRILMNGPLSLLTQMLYLYFFLRFYRGRGGAFSFALFVLLVFISGTVRLPSLNWLPAIMLYLVFDAGRAVRSRLIFSVVALSGFILVFTFYGINPLSVLSRFSSDFPSQAGETREWMTHVLWFRAYLGRMLLMLTAPGIFFIVFALFSAPNLFRVTFLILLAFYYPLVNLNLYNFVHIALVGMALAAWGADYLLETFALHPAGLSYPAGRPTLVLRRFNQAFACLIILAVFLLLRPLTPAIPHSREFYTAAIQARSIYERFVPSGTRVANDGIEGNPNFYGSGLQPLSSELNLASGYYISMDRFSPLALRDAANAWIRWASLPGEYGTLLYVSASPPLSSLPEGYARMSAPPNQPGAFALTDLDLPAGQVDRNTMALTVTQGQTLPLGITWNNPARGHLAVMMWEHRPTGKFLPPPIREGGLTFLKAAMLTMPRSGSSAVYTFEIPKDFPIGEYRVGYFLMQNTGDLKESQNMLQFPVTLRVLPAPENQGEADARTERRFVELYPTMHDRVPGLHTEARWYRNMRVEGYTINRPVDFVFSTPGRPAGDYRLILRGGSLPITSKDSPEPDWAKVSVALSGAPEKTLGVIDLASWDEGEFPLDFHAEQPFDSIILGVDVRFSENAHLPPYLMEFERASYGWEIGTQLARLRGVALEPAQQ